ncbi:MAG: hypothetical protein OZ928_02740 [Polyangiaceae bacterium]|nr:hypothetical protein [Polyangiaceae bacterium]
MASARPSVRSYGALARAVLASQAWPAGDRPESRSLAALFSKLDRDLELEWLAGRPAVQQALAEVLGCAVADLRAAFIPGRSPEARGSERRVTLDDLRFARALDLLEEELFPGLPPEVTRPASFAPLHWLAPGGAGRTLVGQWLEARGLAAFVRAETWTDALSRIPRSGAVYVELERDDGVAAALAGRPLCVAAPFPPRGDGFHMVTSPPPEEWLDALVDWVAARLPEDGRFDAERTRTWLRATGLVDTPGTALGLCGLADSLGARKLEHRSLAELAERFYRDRLRASTGSTSAEASWVERRGFRVLVGMAQRVLTDSDAPLDAPREPEEWLELVPEEHRLGADLEWLRATLVKRGGAIGRADVERAAREVPPGAFRVVRALRGAGLFEPLPGSTRERLRPRWLARVVDELARRELVRGSPFEWGEALLHEHGAAGVARELAARVRRGDHPVSLVLELESDGNPAFAAALEAVFRVSGLALAEGGERPSDELEELYDAGVALAVRLPGELPRPRIGYPRGRGALSDGAWLLAALSLSEGLPIRRGTRPGPLRPWPGGAEPREVRRVLDAIYQAVLRGDAPLHAFLVVDRLRALVGSVALDGGAPHPLELPGIALDESAHGVLAWSTLAALAPLRPALPALELLSRARGVAFSEVALALWNAWREAKRPRLTGSLLDPSGAHAALAFAHAPALALEELITTPEASGAPLPWTSFDAPQWAALVAAAPRAPEAAWEALGLARAYELIPEAHALVALESVSDPRAVRALGRRFPDAMVARALASALPERLALARASEGASARALLRSFLTVEEPANLPPAELDELRGWLAGLIAERGADWREAYQLLASIERSLAPAGMAG